MELGVWQVPDRDRPAGPNLLLRHHQVLGESLVLFDTRRQVWIDRGTCHVLPDHVQVKVIDEMCVLLAPHLARIRQAKIRVVAGGRQRHQTIAVEGERWIRVWVRAAIIPVVNAALV